MRDPGIVSSEKDPAAHRPRRSVILGFVLPTFALSWLLWTGAAAITSPATSPSLRPLYFLPGTFAPAVVGLWYRYAEGGASSVQELLGRLSRTAVSLRWYVLAIGYMIAVKLVVAMLHRLGTSSWPTFGVLPWYLPFALAVSTVTQSGEEIGWRGVALPQLAGRVGLRLGSLALGLIWAVWHLPLFLIPGTDLNGQPFVPFLLGVTALSVPMALLYVRTGGSLLLVMLMHASVNNTAQLVPSMPPGSNSVNVTVAWLTAGVLWIGAVVTLGWMSKDERAGT